MIAQVPDFGLERIDPGQGPPHRLGVVVATVRPRLPLGSVDAPPPPGGGVTVGVLGAWDQPVAEVGRCEYQCIRRRSGVNLGAQERVLDRQVDGSSTSTQASR